MDTSDTTGVDLYKPQAQPLLPVKKEQTDYSFQENQINVETMTLKQMLQFQLKRQFYKLDTLTYTAQHERNMISGVDLVQYNRYCDILPYKHSAVRLSGKTEKEQYVNADYINSPLKDRVYIATQGPIPESIEKFWRMVWETNADTIFMMCKEKNGQIQVKCERYWPESGQEYRKGEIVVKLIGQTSNPATNITERTFLIGNNSSTRQITQIHWEGWPDHGIPQEKDQSVLYELVQKLLAQVEQNKMPIVHCSAGVGRTGTIIALSNIYMYLKYHSVNKTPVESIQVNVFDLIRRLREQRVIMVQMEEQFGLVFDMTKIFVKQLFKL